MKKIAAILIDPVAKTVGFTEIDPGLAGLRKAIGITGCVQEICLARNLALWIDEEGRLKDDLFHGWHVPGWGLDQPVMGRGVITGIDADGENVDIPKGVTPVDVLRLVVADWFEGQAPEPRIQVTTSGDPCSMCGNFILTADDIVRSIGIGQALCPRCRQRRGFT